MAKTAGSKKKRVTFTYKGVPGSDVFVTGSFNEWDPKQKKLKDKKKDGVYSLAVNLPRERHQYKFIVDGEWINDPECTMYEEDGFGGLNSVVDLTDI
ncbi:glycogen-binding domain-containing protein [Chitinivibrio alkaliphilus]|uniref:Early set domain containing protein n=1 Tax=Chitinivibrio alkaliphilus ACht1 TaxID=1313304 RepID=U7D4T2_9BACT|nr:glycogen-binding domain-containing protein [Chitinivibrio alkaliphilus]ERP30948.1 Early set domain containing protein [Chitinivibrio alkaliphilus ACht1]